MPLIGSVDEDGGPQGPSIDSDIQEERIQARRERIAARQLAASGYVTHDSYRHHPSPRTVFSGLYGRQWHHLHESAALFTEAWCLLRQSTACQPAIPISAYPTPPTSLLVAIASGSLQCGVSAACGAAKGGRFRERFGTLGKVAC